jgi:hypothetical protein
MIPTDHLPKPLPRWKCHKEVTAARIKEIQDLGDTVHLTVDLGGDVYGYVLVDWKYMNRHKPAPGGYYVRYANGYESYSPAEAFEAGYTRIAGDWRARVEQEKRELDENIRKLTAFLEPPITHPVGRRQIDLLHMQLSYMKLYSTVLEQRLQETK